jgi:hypothetical protein
MPNQNRRDKMIKRYCTPPPTTPLESTDVLEITLGGSEGGGNPPGFGPGNPSAKKAEGWTPTKEAK